MKPKPAHHERVFRRKCPSYDWAVVTLVVTNDVYESCIRRDPGHTNGYEACTIFRDARYFVILPECCPLGTVCHEAMHVTFDVLEESGVKLLVKDDGGVNDEPWTYLAADLVTWMMRKLLQCDNERTATSSPS